MPNPAMMESVLSRKWSKKLEQYPEISERLKYLGYSGDMSQSDVESFLSGSQPWIQMYYNFGSPELKSLIDAYNSTKDPYIRQQLENAYNTYASQDFSPTFLQGISEGLGDSSARTNFLNSRATNLTSSVEKIMEGEHTEDYTSEGSQLARSKAAGLNLDLAGGNGIESGEPAKIDQTDANNPVLNDGSEAITPIFSAGAQIVSFAMQAYQGFMNVKSMNLDNMVKEFSLSDNARSLAWNLIGEGVSEFMTSPSFDESLKDDPASVALIPSLIQSFGNRVNSLPLSRKQRKYMHSLVDELAYTFDSDGKKVPTAKYQTLINDTLKKLYGSRADSVQEYGRIGADVEDIALQRVVADDIYRPLNEMAIELQSDLQYVTKLQAKYDTSFLTTANNIGLGSMTANADFVAKKMQYEIKKTQTKITQTFNTISRKIEGNKKLGPNWKMAFQTALAIGESWTLNTMMSGLKSFNFSPKLGISTNHDNFAPSY